MRFLVVTFLIVVSGLLYADVSFVAGFLNDNYTGSTYNGESGKYIGADDFLTFSLFTQVKNGRLGISQYYQVVTSRKHDYRYDLFSATVSYDFKYYQYAVVPSVSFLHKGSFGGEGIQNAIHTFKGLPVLVQDYSDEQLSPALGLDFFYTISPQLIRSDRLNGVFTFEAPYKIKPFASSVNLEYIVNFYLVQVDLSVGYKQYLTRVREYSEFVRSGLTFGAQTSISVFRRLTLNTGCFFFPVKNIENDPAYFDKSFSYSPQFWVTLGLKGKDFGILDIVKF